MRKSCLEEEEVGAGVRLLGACIVRGAMSSSLRPVTTFSFPDLSAAGFLRARGGVAVGSVRARRGLSLFGQPLR